MGEPTGGGCGRGPGKPPGTRIFAQRKAPTAKNRVILDVSTQADMMCYAKVGTAASRRGEHPFHADRRPKGIHTMSNGLPSRPAMPRIARHPAPAPLHRRGASHCPMGPLGLCMMRERAGLLPCAARQRAACRTVE
jgi:hypothetical protein